jgi:hypothetical protein
VKAGPLNLAILGVPVYWISNKRAGHVGIKAAENPTIPTAHPLTPNLFSGTGVVARGMGGVVVAWGQGVGEGKGWGCGGGKQRAFGGIAGWLIPPIPPSYFL